MSANILAGLLVRVLNSNILAFFGWSCSAIFYIHRDACGAHVQPNPNYNSIPPPYMYSTWSGLKKRWKMNEEKIWRYVEQRRFWDLTMFKKCTRTRGNLCGAFFYLRQDLLKIHYCFFQLDQNKEPQCAFQTYEFTPHSWVETEQQSETNLTRSQTWGAHAGFSWSVIGRAFARWVAGRQVGSPAQVLSRR